MRNWTGVPNNPLGECTILKGAVDKNILIWLKKTVENGHLKLNYITFININNGTKV